MDTNDLLNSITDMLGNKEGQSKFSDITKMLGSLPAGESTPKRRDDFFSEEIFSYMGRMMESFNRQDNRIELLNSIRPYLRAKRAGNVDMAIRIIRLMNLARDFNFKDVKNVSDI